MFAWLRAMLSLPHWLEIALAVFSITMFVATVVAVPIFVVKIPDDYFVRPSTRRSFPMALVRNVVGATLVVLGLIMLVLPGQGILTILVGLSVLELPIKDRMIERLLRQPRVRGTIDQMRKKAGKGSLALPAAV
jgi:hypothetical protein